MTGTPETSKHTVFGMWTTWSALLLVIIGVVPAGPAADSPDFSIRLVGGEYDRQGSVEMLINGQWQAFCSALFGLKDAEVACRQLGFIDSVPKVSKQRISPREDVRLIDFHCKGNETRLIECPHISVRLSIPCGLSALVECESRKDFSIRLRDKITTSTGFRGRLETYLRGRWTRVCDPMAMDDNLAMVACREFHRPRGLTIPRGLFFSSDNTTERQGLRFKCRGIERRLSECAREVSPVCDGPVEIMCSYSARFSQARLAGSDGKVGRVEMKIGDIWGTVCSEGFSDLDAKVVCRQGGFSTFRALTTVWPNEGFGQASPNMTIWPYEFHCKGNEQSLLNCIRSRVTSGQCTHDKDVAVSCKTFDTIPLPMRLVGTTSNDIGRLEVSMNGQWGTVCRNGFSTEAAKVSCRQMNLPYTEAQVLSTVIQPLSTGPIFLDAVRCSGNERHILSCDHNDIGETNCSHDLDVAIECKGLAEGNDRTCPSGSSRCKKKRRPTSGGTGTVAITVGIVLGFVCCMWCAVMVCIGVFCRRRPRRAGPAKNREISAGLGSYENGVFHTNSGVRYTIQTPYSAPAMEWPEPSTPTSPPAAHVGFGAGPPSGTQLWVDADDPSLDNLPWVSVKAMATLGLVYYHQGDRSMVVPAGPTESNGGNHEDGPSPVVAVKGCPPSRTHSTLPCI